MTNDRGIPKDIKQIVLLSILLIIQFWGLTKLIEYDKILKSDVVNQYDSEFDKSNNDDASKSKSNQYDINNDGFVDELDVTRLKELLSDKNNLTEEELERYDLNKKNGFDTYDVSALKKYLNGEN